MKTLSIFDWDETIMRMPTKVHVEKKVGSLYLPKQLYSDEYSKLRGNKSIRVDNDKSFVEFYSDEKFLIDLDEAITKKRFASAFKTFKEVLINGDDFIIVTSRGHEFNTIQIGIMTIISRCFTYKEQIKMSNNIHDIGEHLSNQKIYAVFSKPFEFSHLNGKFETGAVRKKLALERLLISHDFASDYDKIVFYDDDMDNLISIKKVFDEILKTHRKLELEMYDTSYQTPRLYFTRDLIQV